MSDLLRWERRLRRGWVGFNFRTKTRACSTVSPRPTVDSAHAMRRTSAPRSRNYAGACRRQVGLALRMGQVNKRLRRRGEERGLPDAAHGVQASLPHDAHVAPCPPLHDSGPLDHPALSHCRVGRLLGSLPAAFAVTRRAAQRSQPTGQLQSHARRALAKPSGMQCQAAGAHWPAPPSCVRGALWRGAETAWLPALGERHQSSSSSMAKCAKTSKRMPGALWFTYLTKEYKPGGLATTDSVFGFTGTVSTSSSDVR